MRLRNGLLGVMVAITGFLLVGVAVTELVSSRIEFSLFIGLPAGMIGGIVLGGLTVRWLGSDTATVRHRGAALASFGVSVFGAMVLLTVVIGMRNSRAIPIAAGIGVTVGVALYLWYERRAREVPPVSEK